MSKREDICIYCGKVFNPHNHEKYCKGIHYKKCKICNKEFSFIGNKERKTCSKECNYKLIQLSIKNKLANEGISNVFQRKTVKEKIKNTNLERYGFKSPTQNKEIQNKIMSTNLEKYGQVAWNKKALKETMLKKYGVDSALKSEKIKEKFKKTRNKTTAIKMNNKIAKFMSDDDYAKLLFNKLGVCEISLWEEELEFVSQQIGRRLNALNIEFKKTISKSENNFAKLLKKHNLNFIREFNKIKGYRYDFKVNNTLIEINPTSTHNSNFGLFDLRPKEKDYHLKKTITANNVGYKCIHIFDWDNQEKVIKTLLRKKDNKIYARNCLIKNIDKGLEKDFLNNNHLQGYCGSSLAYGLFYNNKLVGLMTFSKPRFNKKYEWELVRLCFDINTVVIGGSSKLFKFFIEENNPKNVISYQDISKFTGSIYNKLGFKYIKNSGLNYKWCNGKQCLPRYRTQMKNENQEMLSNGYVKVYDCGNNLWEWKRQ